VTAARIQRGDRAADLCRVRCWVAMGPLTIARHPGQTLTVRDRQRAPRAGVRTVSPADGRVNDYIASRAGQENTLLSGSGKRKKFHQSCQPPGKVAHDDRTVCLYPILNDSGGREGSVLHNSGRQRRLQGSSWRPTATFSLTIGEPAREPRRAPGWSEPGKAWRRRHRRPVRVSPWLDPRGSAPLARGGRGRPRRLRG